MSLRFSALFPLLLLALGPLHGAPPNIVLFLVDDLGYGETGCQGNGEIPTPHIDALARNGVRFTQGYVTAPNCSASRAGLLTGRMQTRFGHEHNPTGHHNEDPLAGLPLREKTIGDRLQEAGYATALIGKWHLGGTAPYHPLRRGFDEFFGFLHEGHYFVPPPYRNVTTMLRRKTLPGGGKGRWVSEDGQTLLSSHMGHREPDYDADNPILRGGQPVEESTYLTDALTREAVSFIDRQSERPFFLYLAYNAVHSPLQGATDYMKRFDHIKDVHRRIFAAMLSNLDDSIGQVIARLKAKGLDDNTLIVFLSDNGGPTKELTSSNLPLRGGKGQLYEGGVRVPFLLSFPGQAPLGSVYENPVSSLDLSATFLAAAGVDPVDSADGVDLLPYVNGKKTDRPHQTLYWRQGKRAALREGDWKLVRHRKEWELFNLAVDPEEKDNLAESEPALRDQLVDAWKRMDQTMVDPVWQR